MYSTINAALPNQLECNSDLEYRTGQLLEFQTKVEIRDLYTVEENTGFKALTAQDIVMYKSLQ